VILLILLAVRRRGVRPGVVIISYVALYSVSQFLLDFLRQSEPVIWLGLKELQLTAIVSLVVLVPLLILIWLRIEGRTREALAVLAEAPGCRWSRKVHRDGHEKCTGLGGQPTIAPPPLSFCWST
jgi:prolipoprotein diacylglyceryltransferase